MLLLLPVEPTQRVAFEDLQTMGNPYVHELPHRDVFAFLEKA
uniref:Uncharacterized protein n=1 Tax=Solanum lycopersicum TaxID=4081 RepID=K4B853_SOLLC